MLEHGRGAEPSCEATLRLYTYRSHCALVGRFQSLEDEVDLDAARAAGHRGRPPADRRRGDHHGRRASSASPSRRARPRRPRPRELLERYAPGVVAGLPRLGIEATFRGKNDLQVGGRKIAGLGLYVDDRGALLFHASVLADLDVALMLAGPADPRREAVATRASRASQERVTTVRRETGARGRPPPSCATPSRRASPRRSTSTCGPPR